MAMSDYGAIAFKNGKLMTTDFFGDMKEMVGWEDTEKDTYHNYSTNVDEPLSLAGNYFVYIGDADCTIAFYKTCMYVVENIGGEFFRHFECIGLWSKWKMRIGSSTAVVTKRNGYYVCKWKHKGDRYKVYFGYGVDIELYTKWHVVNAYRTPRFIWRYRILEFFKDKMYDWKFRQEIKRRKRK